ncbi:hypothetical protein AVEN_216675-1 [Araneus ventricosus]|uniref:Uncharacterized protein n=1 Tax=Araneus ventricosus TaxID=182803 RepID=A0A4Y2DTS8_ARAVE|nr:hypothetical protein AVEN_216675-1 [Araneus ventricosus]
MPLFQSFIVKHVFCYIFNDILDTNITGANIRSLFTLHASKPVMELLPNLLYINFSTIIAAVIPGFHITGFDLSATSMINHISGLAEVDRNAELLLTTTIPNQFRVIFGVRVDRVCVPPYPRPS